MREVRVAVEQWFRSSLNRRRRCGWGRAACFNKAAAGAHGALLKDHVVRQGAGVRLSGEAALRGRPVDPELARGRDPVQLTRGPARGRGRRRWGRRRRRWVRGGAAAAGDLAAVGLLRRRPGLQQARIPGVAVEGLALGVREAARRAHGALLHHQVMAKLAGSRFPGESVARRPLDAVPARVRLARVVAHRVASCCWRRPARRRLRRRGHRRRRGRGGRASATVVVAAPLFLSR